MGQWREQDGEMLDKERIRLMTRMASFEANEGKQFIPVTEYFRSDYVGFNMLKTAASVTASFVLFVGVELFCQFEETMSELYELEFASLAVRYLREFLIVLVVYLLIAYIVYSYRYTRARKNVRIYQKSLKRLSAMYGEEEV
ncbi:MAG: hypothetical protein J6O55_06975 [Lachnospiraceae bacterium]|nr:hypothetical protein [Lachnospiraceae bacterium]